MVPRTPAQATHSDPPPAAALVGRDFPSDVCTWAAGRVLKLFHPRPDRECAEREYRATRAGHAAGLPAPAAYEVVQVGGRWGVVFERVEWPSLFDYVQARLWRLPWAVRLLAELLACIHRCPAPAGLPAQREWIAGRIAAAHLPAAVLGAALRRLAAPPDGVAICHGDFHPGNVQVTLGGPMVIDWGLATRGHPLGDMGGTARLIQTAGLPPWAPWPIHLLLRGTRSIFCRRFLAEYRRGVGGTRAEVEAWLGPLAAMAGAPREPATGE